jgi:hypothetical protein
VAGSCVGVLLAIGAFFVGKGQAEKEAGEMIGKAAGETGKSLTDLGAKAGEVATEMPKAIKKQLQGLLLKSDNRQRTDEELLTAVRERVEGLQAKTNRQFSELMDLDFDHQKKIATALKKLGLVEDAEVDPIIGFDALLRLAEEKITELPKAPTPSGIDAEVTKLYEQLIPTGQETNAVKQLAAIAQHQDTAPQLQTQLKQALIDAKVPQDEINKCANFEALLKLAEAKMLQPKATPPKSKALEQLESLVDKVYAEADIKLEHKTAKTFEDKVSVLLGISRGQAETIERNGQQIDALLLIAKELQSQLNTIFAQKTNAVGNELANIVTSAEHSTLTNILTQKVEGAKDFGAHQVKSLDELKEILTNGFEDDGSITRSNSTYLEKQLGFFMQDSQALPTKLTLVAKMLVDCLEKPELNSQLTVKERELVTSYLDNLLSHPQAKASKHYLKTALESNSGNAENFKQDTQFLQRLFEASGNESNLEPLFEHPLLDDFNTPTKKALVLPHLKEALQELRQNPAQLTFKDDLTAPEQIVRRMITSATKEHLLGDLQDKHHLIPTTDWVAAGIDTQKKAIQDLKQTLDNTLGREGSTNTAKIFSNARSSCLPTVLKPLELAHQTPSGIEYTLAEVRTKIEEPLIKGFAELYFPDLLEDYTTKDDFLYRLLGKAAGLSNNPNDVKLAKAITNLEALELHIKAIEGLPAQTTT